MINLTKGKIHPIKIVVCSVFSYGLETVSNRQSQPLSSFTSECQSQPLSSVTSECQSSSRTSTRHSDQKVSPTSRLVLRYLVSSFGHRLHVLVRHKEQSTGEPKVGPVLKEEVQSNNTGTPNPRSSRVW